MTIGGNGIEQIGGNSPSGETLGGSTTSKISFYGQTPVVQAAAITSVTTSAITATGGYGFANTTQASQAITAINSLILALGSTSGVGLIG